MHHRIITAAIAAALLLGAAWPLQAQRIDDRKQLAFDTIDKNAQPMTDISDSIFYFGEPGMQEFESTKLLKDTLEAAGFKVELGGAGMPTNLWAEYGSGHPKIAIVTEIDALPGGSQTPGEFTRKPLVPGAPGHMEGHNTHGGVASMAAFAVKQVMQRYNLPGTVAISFGPAEEQIASRPYLVRAGYFKDVDAVICPAHRGLRSRPATACRTTRRSARSSPSTARPRTARSIRGTARTRSTRSN